MKCRIRFNSTLKSLLVMTLSPLLLVGGIFWDILNGIEKGLRPLYKVRFRNVKPYSDRDFIKAMYEC